MAGRVADSIRTGGQEVKEIVVEGAEQVIAAAKPKIQYGMSKMAWRVRRRMWTDAMYAHVMFVACHDNLAE